MYGQGEYVRLNQDVLKTSSEDEDERCLQDVFIKTNVWWVMCYVAMSEICDNGQTFLNDLNKS